MNDTITYDFWLSFNRYGGAPKATKNSPNLSADDRAMRVTVALPKSIFIRPQLSAKITVDEELVPTPHIDVQAIEGAIESVIGGTVIMEIVSPEPPSDEGKE